MMALVHGRVAIGYFVVGALCLSACVEEEVVDGEFTPAEWKKIESYSPLPAQPQSLTNRFADDAGAAAFGQRMFFEKRYSGPITITAPGSLGSLGETGKYSCASCHDSELWFIDTRSPDNLSTGAATITKRNSPSMVNIAYYVWGGWGGAQDQLWKQGANSPESKDLNGDRLAVAHVVYDHYRDDYNAVFGSSDALDPALDASAPDAWRFPLRGKPKASPGDPDGLWEMMAPADQKIVNTIMANVGKSFEAYERRLVSRDAPFDRYVAGDFGALNANAKHGLKLFIGKAGCGSCHETETFSDQKFHNTAVSQMNMMPQDLGRFDDVPRLQNMFNGAGEFSDDKVAGAEKLAEVPSTFMPTLEMTGQFRTKSLRQAAETGPYFHNGSVSTLEDVVRHYNRGGASEDYPGTKDALIVPLNLSEVEIRDLVEFLESLTGEPVLEEFTRDTSAP